MFVLIVVSIPPSLCLHVSLSVSCSLSLSCSLSQFFPLSVDFSQFNFLSAGTGLPLLCRGGSYCSDHSGLPTGECHPGYYCIGGLSTPTPVNVSCFSPSFFPFFLPPYFLPSFLLCSFLPWLPSMAYFLPFSSSFLLPFFLSLFPSSYYFSYLFFLPSFLFFLHSFLPSSSSSSSFHHFFLTSEVVHFI